MPFVWRPMQSLSNEFDADDESGPQVQAMQSSLLLPCDCFQTAHYVLCMQDMHPDLDGLNLTCLFTVLHPTATQLPCCLSYRLTELALDLCDASFQTLPRVATFLQTCAA